jgi:ribosomal protein L13
MRKRAFALSPQATCHWVAVDAQTKIAGVTSNVIALDLRSAESPH